MIKINKLIRCDRKIGNCHGNDKIDKITIDLIKIMI